jgi:hypothetical protein
MAPRRLKELYYFGYALVAAFRNVFKNVNRDMRDVDVVLDGETLEIRNYRQNKDDGDDAGALSFGTVEVLRRNVQEYRPDAENIVLFEHSKDNKRVWITRLPLPEHFLDDQDIPY